MKLRPFELALIVIFSCLALFAIVFLSTYKGGSDDGKDGPVIGNVSIWGTMPQQSINDVLEQLADSNEAYEKVKYSYLSPAVFEDTLTNALADDEGPDLILVSHEKLAESRKRIQPISFEFFPIRDMRNNYLDGAQIFALNDGVYAYPIAVDPLMMYWNTDILATEGFLEPSSTWEDLVNSMFPSLIKRDSDRSITRSVVAMGESSNIRNSFGIISSLIIQGGTEGVIVDEKGNYQVKLRVSTNGSGDPLRSAVDFYTRFSKPSNALYSWNRSFAEDRQKFISGELALYFGYGSEGTLLEKINPNLNFDIAEVPQGASASVRRTYGKFYGLSMLKSSRNVAGASAVMSALGSSDVSSKIAVDSEMVPTFRNQVSSGSNGIYSRATYMSAPIALGWLNPELSNTEQIFSTMTRDINENRQGIDGAVADAVDKLESGY